MVQYKCPVGGKLLTKAEYERALKIHEAKERHLRQLEQSLRNRERQQAKKTDEPRRQGQEKEKRRSERLLAGWKNKVKTLEDRIRQLERGSTPQTEGLEFEDKLTNRLKGEFPEHDIQHLGKNGDVLRIVKFQNKPPAISCTSANPPPRQAMLIFSNAAGQNNIVGLIALCW